MTQEHPIRPPHELVQQWVSLACENEGYETWQDLATQAARWGADQELEACCEWLSVPCPSYGRELRNARRPKPPSLKEQALDSWDRLRNEAWCQEIDRDLDFIRRALESLPS